MRCGDAFIWRTSARQIKADERKAQTGERKDDHNDVDDGGRPFIDQSILTWLSWR